MSNVTCNVANELISEEEWELIHNESIKAMMSTQDDNLRELIAQDEKVIYDAGLTFEQLEDFFSSFELVCRKAPETTNKAFDLLKYLPKFLDLDRTQWCLQYQVAHRFTLFNIEYLVFRHIWGGAAACPFQNQKLDKRYHGYEYGSVDYVIYRQDIDKAMHIGNLLFHQICAHHFFQSKESNYRVDPKDLIELFSLQPGQNYKVETKLENYAKVSGGSTNLFDKEKADLDANYNVEFSSDQITFYKAKDENHSVFNNRVIWSKGGETSDGETAGRNNVFEFNDVKYRLWSYRSYTFFYKEDEVVRTPVLGSSIQY
jgi:hypothetical protein